MDSTNGLELLLETAILVSFSVVDYVKIIPRNNYLLRFNKRNIKKRCETLENSVNFEHILHLFLVFLLLTLNR